MNSKIIALLTDFGNDDPYVGIMKGVISDLAPGTHTIDITHLIPPGDIQRGAFVLWQAARDFPQGTIFLSVIDPGVGSKRKAIILERSGQTFIGPDNGLFSYLFFKHEFNCWELSNPQYQRAAHSATFHGRDLFAPAAAYSAKSVPGKEFGPRVSSLTSLPEPQLIIKEGSIAGEVLSQDHFGNLFTTIGHIKHHAGSFAIQSWIDGKEYSVENSSNMRIKVNDHYLPFIETFSSVDQGSCAGLIGSTGLLEIVANQGSAKSLLGLKNGSPVSLSWDYT